MGVGTDIIDSQCVTLVGMPASGKTTIGRKLAARLQWTFVDVDKLIEDGEGCRLCDVISAQGLPAFLDIEAHYAASVTGQQLVIAPGGSVVYRERAMEHLRSLGPIIYLELSFRDLARRLSDLTARGVAIAPGSTLEDLYAERVPLYERYCTHRVNCCGLPASKVAAGIAEIIVGVQPES